MPKPDYYTLLGITPTVTPEQIRAAHRAQARRYHPDTADDGRGDPNLFARIQEAYEILSNSDYRRRYDSKRAAARGEGRPTGPRRPPKAPCRACGKQIYASQLNLYLGRFICKPCLDRKRAREAKRPRLTGLLELQWQLKRLRVWAHSHLATLLVLIAATGVACARLTWVMSHARHAPPPADVTTTTSAETPTATLPLRSATGDKDFADEFSSHATAK